ncbi:hypothetical protein EV363DRAFT_1307961 [Boletus edulis]|nr:hypothetical protein EV363DRAFT_1307961 [Boletus edulis]
MRSAPGTYLTLSLPTGRFIPGPPYKLTGDFAPPIYVPLSEPGGPTDRESGAGPTPVQTSDTPSTPMSIPRKRNREQAYFDSPSGSLVFSGFDKDGMPRRPRKQRKLRFDPSFSPESGRSGRGAVQGAGPDCHRDHHGASWDDDIRDENKLDGMVVCLTAPRPPDTPDKPLTNRKRPTTHLHLSVDEYLSNSPAISIYKQEKIPPVRTIDFANPPPPTRRFPFPVADTTKSGDMGMMLSVVKSTDHKVKTPKKISFANHARVCVYVISPQRPATKGDVGAGPAQHAPNQRFEDGPEVDGKTRISSDEVKDSDDSTAEATQDLGLRTSTPKINDDRPWHHSGAQSKNATLTLTMEEVQRMRRHLLELAETNGISDGQLATSFELGKTYRGMAFNHVW